MSQLIYSPFGALNQLHRELSRVFTDDGRYEPASYESTNWSPQVDIHEEEDRFLVNVDVPGVAAQDIDITLDRNVLTIKGSRSTERETENKGFKRRERVSGSFIRQFTLPETADENAITARANNGVLEISIPKGQENKPRSIAVEG
ncbi:MAG: Hsp20/alpha crystallin family protein [Pseudomonadales bacterium]|nr:Hsp20/alpha crystallin family protein [Pseudomonadales bacterium]